MTDFVVKHKLNSIKDKIPQSSELENGEIVINDNKDNEALFIKNNEGEIVTFKSKESIDSELEPIIEDIYRIIGWKSINGITVVASSSPIHLYLTSPFTFQEIEVTPNEPKFIELEKGLITYNTFCNNSNILSIDFSSFDASNLPTELGLFSSNEAWSYPGTFYGCSSLIELDLSDWDTSNVTNMGAMFYNCSSLQTLYLDKFDMSSIKKGYGSNTYAFNMFYGCNSLNYIRCKQAFKDWCLANKNDIGLPAAMQEGGSGTWEIID